MQDDSKQQAQAQAQAQAPQQSQQQQHKRKSRRHRKHHDTSNMRIIGRWYIGETLGKGGYSWVKKGYDKKTGKCVALKFMAQADDSWVAEQSKQVVTEIESLKQIRHSNVMKLYAYNLNARYPSKDDKSGKDTTVDTILLVLEYAPGGELFDILYYTSALEEIVARTYFRQIIAGLEACHNAGVVHRDLKPQNLLLDSRFNIKITDFGLSKLFEDKNVNDAQMKTTYVGTRGYQAPELLLDKAYNKSCDIFSIGVILFILLTGYPPFEQATSKDRWYKSMTKKKINYATFWKAHRASPLGNNNLAKDLIQRMLAFDPQKRITIEDIKKHDWYNGKHLDNKELIRVLRTRHHDMEIKRKKDSRKQEDLQHSIKKRDVEFKGAVIPSLIPDDIDETVGLLHTTVDWQEVYNVIDGKIGQVGGATQFIKDRNTLICKMNIANANSSQLENITLFEFAVEIFVSQLYNDDKVFKMIDELKEQAIKNQAELEKGKQDNNNSNQELQAQSRKDQMQARKSVQTCYVVRIVRLEGDELVFQNKIKRNFLMNVCGSLFNGIPKNRLPKDNDNKDIFEDIEDEDEDDVDYDTFLKDEGFAMDPTKSLVGIKAANGDGAAVAAVSAVGDSKVDE